MDELSKLWQLQEKAKRRSFNSAARKVKMIIGGAAESKAASAFGGASPRVSALRQGAAAGASPPGSPRGPGPLARVLSTDAADDAPPARGCGQFGDAPAADPNWRLRLQQDADGAVPLQPEPPSGPSPSGRAAPVIVQAPPAVVDTKAIEGALGRMLAAHSSEMMKAMASLNDRLEGQAIAQATLDQKVSQLLASQSGSKGVINAESFDSGDGAWGQP